MEYDFLDELKISIDKVLETKDRALISVIGKGGTGKSYFGKYLRNYGIGQYSRRDILVIDDGIMWVRFLYFFRRKVKLEHSKYQKLDDFFKSLPGRIKAVFYINATPWDKISESDILLRLTIDNKTRIKRLHNRYKNDSKMLKKAIESRNTESGSIGYKYFIEGKS